MKTNGIQSAVEQETGRRWSFSGCEFDGLSRQLRIYGRLVLMEAKPLEVLHFLLEGEGRVVAKEEIIRKVWGFGSDESLTTAIFKLRKALEPNGSTIISTVPKQGYRIGVPVTTFSVEASSFLHSQLLPGSSLAQREEWKLVQPLDGPQSRRVWLMRHSKTRELRVVKFAPDWEGLDALRRELAVFLLLRAVPVNVQGAFVRVLDHNFSEAPYWLESEYCGWNLVQWAVGDEHSDPELKGTPLPIRIRMMATLARAVAGAHRLGVLHRDLKPSNVLVTRGEDGEWQVKIADFGVASLSDPSMLTAMDITDPGTWAGATRPGTAMYLAPEVIAGQPATVQSDVYALGVMLYQMVAGDLHTPPSPGWEKDIADPLLREDIIDAACVDPARRLQSAELLAERLESLSARHERLNAAAVLAEQAQQATRHLAKLKAQQPWIVATAIMLLLGLSASLLLYRNALSQRNFAARQTAIANSINLFVKDNLLERSNPFLAGNTNESLMGAIAAAVPAIDEDFKQEPLVAASLHQSIANALDSRLQFKDARREYERAAELYRSAESAPSPGSILCELQLGTMEARSYQPGSLALAESILSQQQNLLSRLPGRRDLFAWLYEARGVTAVVENQPSLAGSNFQSAIGIAQSISGFDPNSMAQWKQRQIFALVRNQDGATAESLAHRLLAELAMRNQLDRPIALLVRLNLAMAFRTEGKNQEAIREASAIYPLFQSQLGDSNSFTLQVLGTRAAAEGSSEQWNQAITDDLLLHALASSSPSPNLFLAIGSLSDAALSQCRSGQVKVGTANARQASVQARKVFADNAGVLGGIQYALASCLIESNELNEASRVLAGIDSAAVAHLDGAGNWEANLKLAHVQIAFKEGDMDTVRKDILAVVNAFASPMAESYQRRVADALRAAVFDNP